MTSPQRPHARRDQARPRAPERVADGVWVVRGGLPRRTMNVCPAGGRAPPAAA